MVDKIAIQRTVPGRGLALVSPDSARMEEKKNKLTYKNTELIQADAGQTGGRIHFTYEVMETLAFVSAMEVPGLAVQIGAHDISQERMLKRSRLREIHVRFLEDQVHIYLSITVKPGYRPVCVAKEVQERVRNNIENMTGLVVAAVNVHVASIQAQGTAHLH